MTAYRWLKAYRLDSGDGFAPVKKGQRPRLDAALGDTQDSRRRGARMGGLGRERRAPASPLSPRIP